MINRGVWRKTDRAKIPKNRRLIGNKWVFKIKRDGMYRARLVALGYSQIPGVDYTDNFAPVAHDVSFRIALARMMVKKLDNLVMDVETAFLYGKIIIKFVKSEENEADIFTKNTTNMTFHNHQKKLVWDKTNVDNEMKQELTQSDNQQEGC